MKKVISFIFLITPLFLLAQYSALEIKKMKISKMTISGDEPGAQKYEQYFDRNGNDTATYSGGLLNARKVYSFDNLGKPEKVSRYNAEGNETETGLYHYNPDGTYTITNTDKSYGMADYQWYDKWGKLAKTQSPDGFQRIYAYDAKGKLISIKTKNGSKGKIVGDLRYTYNTKGQLIKAVSSGEHKWATTYAYNEKGWLARATTISTSDGEETKSRVHYVYEFWK
jgi:YD repeat-containing protein